MKTLASTLCVLLLVLAGCSESVSGRDAGPTPDAGATQDAGTPPEDSGPPPVDSGTPLDSGAPVDSGMPSDGGAVPDLSALVFNEIESSDEWVEFYNGGSETLTLDGLRYTDDDEGMPDEGHTIVLPAGTTIESGGYLILVEGAEGTAGTIGMDDACVVGDRCVLTEFGFSGANGDVVYLLGPEGDDTILLQQALPMNATGDGESYCRTPNATGDFAPCTPTPGATNTGV